jgi:hypothetical protein
LGRSNWILIYTVIITEIRQQKSFLPETTKHSFIYLTSPRILSQYLKKQKNQAKKTIKITWQNWGWSEIRLKMQSISFTRPNQSSSTFERLCTNFPSDSKHCMIKSWLLKLITITLIYNNKPCSFWNYVSDEQKHLAKI